MLAASRDGPIEPRNQRHHIARGARVRSVHDGFRAHLYCEGDLTREGVPALKLTQLVRF